MKNGTMVFVKYDNKYLRKWQNSYRQTPRKSSIALFDIKNDPFELNNLAFNPEYTGPMKKIRKWAEAEIGRPPISVVGGWNNAYREMLSLFADEGKYKISFDSEYLLMSKRAVPYKSCKTEKICNDTMLTVTGWSVNGTIEFDFAEFSREIALLNRKARRKTDSSREKLVLDQFWIWTKLCGKLCCPLRERRAIDSQFDTQQY